MALTVLDYFFYLKTGDYHRVHFKKRLARSQLTHPKNVTMLKLCGSLNSKLKCLFFNHFLYLLDAFSVQSFAPDCFFNHNLKLVYICCWSSVCLTVIEISEGLDFDLERSGLNRASHAWSFLLRGIGAVLTFSDLRRLQQRQMATMRIMRRRISSITPRVMAAISPGLK